MEEDNIYTDLGIDEIPTNFEIRVLDEFESKRIKREFDIE